MEKTVIRIEDEVKHAQEYMNIQKIRYKNSFEVDFRYPEILDGCTVKLVLQPLLENAILLWNGVYGWRRRNPCTRIPERK